MRTALCGLLATTITTLAAAQEAITIASAADLQGVATAVNSGITDYAGATLTLGADLDLSAIAPWTPIGTTTHPFAGTFDGGHHRITHLSVALDGSATGNVAGLFGYIAPEGTVRDLAVSGLVTISEKTAPEAACAAGAIAGYNKGTILRCANSAEVRGNQDNASVGGIAGENTATGHIVGCYSLGEVYTGASYTGNKLGGIVGENNGTVTGCFVSAPVSDATATGPITGNNSGTVAACFYMGGTPADAAVTLTLSDNPAAAIAAADGETHNVLIAGRTLYADGSWNTLCLPFAIEGSPDGRSPIAGATVKELTEATLAGTTLVLRFTDATSILAGRPYILRWDDDLAASPSLSDPVFLGVTIADRDEAARTVSSAAENVHFIGTFDPVTLPPYDPSGASSPDAPFTLYLGDGNLLYYPTVPVPVGAFRAYFRLSDAARPSVKSIRLDLGDDTATGIGTMGSSAEGRFDSSKNGQLARKPLQPSNELYDLSGRPATPSSRALYITGGKKVLLMP